MPKVPLRHKRARRWLAAWKRSARTYDQTKGTFEVSRLRVTTLVICCLLGAARGAPFDSGLHVDGMLVDGRGGALSGKTHTGKNNCARPRSRAARSALLTFWAHCTATRQCDRSTATMATNSPCDLAQKRVARRMQSCPHNASRVPAQKASGPREALPSPSRRSHGGIKARET